MKSTGEAIVQAIQQFCPPRFALERDPTGLQVGRVDREIDHVLCALDLTLAVAEEARDRGAQLIVSHHAVIFRPLRDIRTDRPRGRILEVLLKHDIAVYVPHTAFDVTTGGLNDHLASVAGLQQTAPLRATDAGDPETGIGRYGRLANAIPLGELARQCASKLDAPAARVVGTPAETVQNVAVLCGDGRSFLHDAIGQRVDVLITGDIDHHTALEAKAQGIALIDLGHWATERIAGQLMADALRERVSDAKITFSASNVVTQPFTYVTA